MSVTVLSIRQKIVAAMQSPDSKVLLVKYVDSKLNVTTRTVSPIRFSQDGKHVDVMCLGRESVRTFLLEGIVSADLVDASNVLMPEPIVQCK